jgi:ferredoxin
MLDRIPRWLRRVRWEASDRAWRSQWRAVRAVATPWVKKELAAAREKLAAAASTKREVVIDRDALDRWLREAAPPGVPFEAVVLPGRELAQRFADGPTERRGTHLVGKLRMTHRAPQSEAVLVLVLFSDVAADYFIESMAADVAGSINGAYGDDVAIAEAQAGVPVVLKEFATAAGLGVIGKNALFHSHRFGFNCKLSVVFLNAPVSRYDATPTSSEWKLPDCSTCNLCVEACPVGAFDDYKMIKVESCDRLIAADYFGPRRDHMCRACITRCPVSNDLLKIRRREGVPQRAFWDNEAQLALAADLFMYRPSFWIWVLQRFYYGATMPGREARDKKSLTSALSSSVSIATSDRTRDGWRLAARAANEPDDE